MVESCACKLSNYLLRPQNQWNEQPGCEKPSTVGWTSTVRFDCLLKVCVPSLQDEDKWLPSLRLPSNKNMMHLWNLTFRTTYPTVSSVWAHEPWRAQEGDMFLEHLNLGALAASRGLWNPNQFVAPRPAWCKCEQHMMNMEHHGSMWIFRMTSIAPVTRELPVPCWCESQVVWANWSGCEGGGPCHWHRFPDWAKVAEQNGTGWQLMEIKWRQGRIGRKRDAVSTNFALVVWGSNMGFLKMGDPQNQRFQD